VRVSLVSGSGVTVPKSRVRRGCLPLAGGILGDENRVGPLAEPGFSLVR
jgi:hypothetical protein